VRELLLALAGLVTVIALVTAGALSGDARPTVTPSLDSDIPQDFRGPNIIWQERLPGAKTRALSVERGNASNPDGCGFALRASGPTGRDGQVSYTLAQNPDTCDILVETITFDPDDPTVHPFFRAVLGSGMPPSSGSPIPAPAPPTPARAQRRA
jgi:hypothetical protein